MKPPQFPSPAVPSPDDSAWEKLAAAHRHSQTGQEPADDSLPFGFAPRVAAQAMALRREAPLSCWTRWSLRAALGAMMVAALVARLSPSPESGTSLLQPPALEIPGLASL